MKGKYITTQIRIASLSHRKNGTTIETNEKIADLANYTIVWKKKNSRKEVTKVLIDF